jgi:two-component system CheB/CheR fusion protein
MGKRSKGLPLAASRVSRPKPRPAKVSSDAQTEQFAIVGIGASAGGLEAFQQLLKLLPSDTGMAFVLVQHLDPTHPSLLASILSKATAMTVTEAKSGLLVRPNQVYVVPPNVDMALLKRTLTLTPRPETPGPHLAIDFFFRSLATEEGNRAIGVLLSGTGTDGTEGLRAIKAEAGITFAQAMSTAKFRGMPEHAIGAGVVDAALPVDKIVEELVRLSHHPYVAPRTAAQEIELAAPQEHDVLNQIFVLVRGATGIDFSDYKSTTIKRRLARRMALRKLESLDAYEKALRKDPAEAQALCNDVFIHVTEFFRNPDVFDALKKQVFPELVRRHRDGSGIRVWVPGCSTGQEVFSLAICLLEVLGEEVGKLRVQIFGSDISAGAIETARAGLYSEESLRELSPARRERFFTPTDGGYRIAKSIRDLCVFVKHDLARDPPFAKVDLISCRNVLIYFGANLQQRTVQHFHYCLNPEGFLVLGHTEAISAFAQQFGVIDKASKIFMKVGGRATTAIGAPSWERTAGVTPVGIRSPAAPQTGTDAQRQVDTMLLGRFAPPGVVVNERMDVVQIRGRTSPYLELPPGQPNMNLLKLVREELMPELRRAFEQAKKESVTVRRHGLPLQHHGVETTVDLEIMPIAGLPSKERFFLVLFESPAPVPLVSTSTGPLSKAKAPLKAPANPQEVVRLKEELAATKNYLQSVHDERQRMYDELTTANEELVSGNEELQSTNEELETAKEELQSANEELTTVNDELQSRHEEQDRLNSDLVNLLAAVDMAVIIIGGDRRIRRFTPRARSLMNLIPSDVGRPIDDIRPNVQVTDLDQQISEVIESITQRESEVQDRDGRWYRLQIRPYRTIDNRLDGVVISLVDIDALKQTVTSTAQALEYVAAIVETVRVPLVVLDDRLVVVSVNHAFYRVFGSGPADVQHRKFFELSRGAWNVDGLRQRVETSLSQGAALETEIELSLHPDHKRRVTVGANAMRIEHGRKLLLLTLLDVTERATMLADTQRARSEAERANLTKDLFLATLSHELRTPLASVVLRAALLQRGNLAPDKVLGIGQAIERATKVQAQLIDDLLDISRIVSGKLEIQRLPVDLSLCVNNAVDTVRGNAEARSIQLQLDLDRKVESIYGDAMRLQQVVWNLLNNAIKFTPPGGTVTVSLMRQESQARISISDTGQGIAPEFLPQIFDRFTQADSTSTRTFGGLGLGLAIVRDLVSLHGGTVRAESPGKGKGTTFIVLFPLPKELALNAQPSSGAETTPAGIRSPAGDSLRGTRVLTVDDDASTREAIAEILAGYGVDVRTAGSAAEALKLLPSFLPDALLCDLAMPNEDGYSLLRQIRALDDKQGGRVPAAAVTAFVSKNDRERTLAAGFKLHVAKPASAETLHDTITQLISESRAASP